MSARTCASKRAFTDQAGVKDGRGVTPHPAPAVVRTGKWVKTSRHRPERVSVKRLLRQGIQLIEKIGIVDHFTLMRSQMHAIQKLIDDGEYFIDVSLLQ